MCSKSRPRPTSARSRPPTTAFPSSSCVGSFRDAGVDGKDRSRLTWRPLGVNRRDCSHPDVNTSPEAKAKFLALSEAYETLGNDHKRREYDRTRLRHSTSNLRHTPRNSARNNVRERKYGVHEAAARSKHYNHDAHQRGHYGMGDSKGSAWHQDRMERKRQEEYDAWQAELEKGRAHTKESWVLGIGLSLLALFAAFR
ncbi:hypothetical protein, variant [Allomyces macrogynus ATCC 38327]|uniref:J domain-containing protein n=1 Tax=Allomyces macrogynus (strain ATCC 38327) TaxID=578462 RepID=A0A0L0T650_ALLM3|nr:hypothetical protein, variant [Allomyces macrogynus ATCC 38327]|eukprot:KNE70166.1 hypothetical protein, variant [Allomyces macrogynus ATCC 38327]